MGSARSAASARAATPAESKRPRITMIGKPDCHLCEDARAVIERVCADTGETFVERNILDEPELLASYAEQIPVTLVDGKQHDYWRVDEARLRKALARRRVFGRR